MKIIRTITHFDRIDVFVGDKKTKLGVEDKYTISLQTIMEAGEKDA